MTDSFAVRMATPSDIPTIAQHRAQMFRDMGELPPSVYQQLVDATIVYLQSAIPMAEYVGWLAARAGRPDEVVAGAGLQLRRLVLHASDQARGLYERLGFVSTNEMRFVGGPRRP